MSPATQDAFAERNVRGKTSQTKEGGMRLQLHCVAIGISSFLNKLILLKYL